MDPTLALVKVTPAPLLKLAILRVVQSRLISRAPALQVGVADTTAVLASIGLAVRSPTQPAGL